MVLNQLVIKTFLIMLCLCSAAQGLSAQQGDENEVNLTYRTVVSELPKEIKNIEKSVALLRKSYGKYKAKEFEISSQLQQAAVKVSSLEQQKSKEVRENHKIKLAKKLAKENAKYEDLSISLEIIQRELADIKSSLTRKETDLSTLRGLYRSLKSFGPLKRKLYEKFVEKVELATYWQAEYETIVEGITVIKQPKAVLTAIELDQSLCSLEQFNFLASLSTEQVNAWKITKSLSKNGDEVDITMLSHIQNHYQVKILNYLLDKNKFKARYLDDLKFIDNKLLADAYIYLIDHGEEAPEGFWEKVYHIKGDWQHSPSFVFQSMKLLKHKLERIHPYLWDLMPYWDNQNSFQCLNSLLNTESAREKLTAWSLDENEVELDANIHELLLQSNRVSSKEQMQAFIYYCSLESSDPLLILEKNILHLLGFRPQMLANIDTSTKLGGLMLLIKQYSAFLRKSRPNDYASFPWEKVIKQFPFERLDDLKPHQLRAIESSVEQKNKIPHLNEYSYIDNQYKLEAFKEALSKKLKLKSEVYQGINSPLDVEIFSLCLKHHSSPKNPFLYERFKRIPYKFRSFAKQILSDLLEQKNGEVSRLALDLLVQVESISSVRMIKYLLDNGKGSFLGDWVLHVDDETKFTVVRLCLEKFEKLPLSDLSMLLPQITSFDHLFLLEAMIAKGFDLKESFEKIKFEPTIAGKVNALGLNHEFWKSQLDQIFQEVPEILEQDYEEDNKEYTLDPKFEEFLQTYKNSRKARQLFNAGYLTLCRTKDCPGLIVVTKEDNNYCSACDEAFCKQCDHHAHSGACDDFAANHYKVASKDFPGAANFRKGLVNVCFFNSLMKLMTQMASTIPEFKEFLDPNIESDAFIQAGDGQTDDYNGYRRKLKYALNRWVRHALQGYDMNEDSLAELSHQVFAPLKSLLELDQNDLGVALNHEQLDSQEVFSYILSKLGFEHSELAMDIDQELSLEQVEYVSHKKDPYSLLSVPIAGVHELDKAVNKFWDSVTLDHDNWLRHSDGEKYETKQTMRLVNKPKLIVIHQKRFVHEKGLFGRGWVEKKLTHAVKVNEHIKIPRYDSQDFNEPSEELEYELVAMTLHKGNRVDAGHYIAYTVEPGVYKEESERFAFLGKKKVFPYQFVIHDDARVGEVASMSAASDAADREAYLLAYKLKENND